MAPTRYMVELGTEIYMLTLQVQGVALLLIFKSSIRYDILILLRPTQRDI
jgi:hypothetical protein